MFDKIKFHEIVSPVQSPWLEKAKWRQRNRWWLNIVARIQVKYYRYLRKFGLR